MSVRRTLAAAAVAAALLGACGSDDTEPAETGDAPTTTSTTEATTTTATTEGDATTTSTTAGGEDAEAGALAAAEDFMATFFPDATATVGEFRQGDARSGEVEVFRPTEGGGQGNLASTLLVRLDDADEWQVIGATNQFMTIEDLTAGDEVAAGPLTVTGVGRGFEATLNVRAAAADGSEIGDIAVAQGGALAEPAPYEATVDLSGATAGDDVYVILQGGTGLDGDPGEFAAVRLTVG